MLFRSALETGDLTADGSGKLADADIRELCAGQYKVVQGAADGRLAPNMPLFCRYDGIETYGDDVYSNSAKKCSLTYSADPSAYTQSPSSSSWNYGFSTWGRMYGGTILQLRYGDMREGNTRHNASPRSGSHAAAYDLTAGRPTCAARARAARRSGARRRRCPRATTSSCRLMARCASPAPTASRRKPRGRARIRPPASS